MTSSLATLAFKVTTSPVGIKFFNVALPLVVGSLTSNMSGALSIMNLVGLVLAFGGLLFAAIMFMMGQTERMIYGLVGALIGGLAFLIVKAMFGSSGDQNASALELGTVSQ